MVQTNIQVAQSQVQEALKVSQDANKKLAETKVMEVERTTQHAVSLENNNDEEDIPEAYLREDWDKYPIGIRRKREQKKSFIYSQSHMVTTVQHHSS